MHKNAIKESFNYNHYLSLRADKKKVLKWCCYDLLDDSDDLFRQVSKKHTEDEERYKANCDFFDKLCVK